ncbi:penicillin-binding protein [Burkholderia thailandensis]|nr:penicillin-binding protein [Burkholderia thailandensis]AWY60161.1 penicillin-binding protein [Burkholderia thailandensis]AWY68791.1 penicillin-binding protein [Burkholderia thailandensis]NOK43849.1 penicillin-binding protein [Burkholderia thailandensis]NOK55447.1 penicillin-binding protein [Burkholderia thailandensis]
MRIARKKTDESRCARQAAMRTRLRVECRLGEFLTERNRR